MNRISKSKKVNIVFLIMGIALILIFLIGDFPKNINGLFLGIGAGIIGMSISNLVAIFYFKNNPDKAIIEEIEYSDERNVLIRYRAKATVGDIIQWTIIIAAYISIVMKSELWVTLCLVAVFVWKKILEFYFINKYQKEI